VTGLGIGQLTMITSLMRESLTSGPIKTEWKPSDVVEHTGLYSVRHGNEHKLARYPLQHEVICQKGHKFPLCNQCGNQPRFNLIGVGGPIEQNDYFK
jgi:hypothetical protein